MVALHLPLSVPIVLLRTGETTALLIPNTNFFREQTPPRLLCPRQAFLDDIAQALKKFYEQGDHVILFMDANEPLLYKIDNPVETSFAPFMIKDIILSKHDRSRAPSTYERGSKPIDGIFTTAALSPSICGYLPFHLSPADHRVLWLDSPLLLLFGERTKGPIAPSTARRLKCNDPRSI